MKRYLPLTGLLLFAHLFSSAQDGYPIAHSPKPPPFGLYKTGNEYLNLQPSDTEALFIHIPAMEGDGVNNFYRKEPGNKKGERFSPQDYFAASDGTTFYISYGEAWYKTKKIDTAYYFLAQSRLPHPGRDPHPHIILSGSGYNDRMDIMAIEESNAKYKMSYSIEQGQWVPGPRMKKLK